MSLFKLLRLAVLITILIIVAGNHYLGKSRLSGWQKPVWITIYPIIADGSTSARDYSARLDAGHFEDLGVFLSREASKFGRTLSDPVHIQLAPQLEQLPPPPPIGDGRVSIALWSLKMRWWAWRRGAEDGLPEPDIQVFVLYREGENSPDLDRSIGIQRGRYAVVNAYASQRQASRNRVVILHELFHVLGATDKYDLRTGQPLAPEGLANPGLTPLFPQRHAEIMGGRIARSPSVSDMPASLGQCVVGPDTAREIGWLNPPGA